MNLDIISILITNTHLKANNLMVITNSDKATNKNTKITTRTTIIMIVTIDRITDIVNMTISKIELQIQISEGLTSKIVKMS